MSTGQESQEDFDKTEEYRRHAGLDGCLGCVCQKQFRWYRVREDVQRGEPKLTDGDSEAKGIRHFTVPSIWWKRMCAK